MDENQIINRKIPNSIVILYLAIILAIGSFIRFQFFNKYEFVLNDGGMFYTMTTDLINNHFRLPAFTTYNSSQIPFAYPPLSFYLAGFIHQFLSIDLLLIIKYIPVIYNLISIPAFFFFSNEFTQNKKLALIATFFYAITIPAFDWLISGGGLTRSPSHTFFILSLWGYLVFRRTRQWKMFFLSTVFGVLMTLHHLEYSLLLIISTILFSIGTYKIKEIIRNSVFFVLVLGLFTAPYWATILKFHGISPFISAFSTGEFNFLDSFVRAIFLLYSQELNNSFINILGIVGLFACLFTKRKNLVIWFLLIQFLNPRSANRLLVLPIMLCAAIALDRVIIPGLRRLTESSEPELSIRKSTTLKWKFLLEIGNLFLGISLILPFSQSLITSFQENQVLKALSNNERNAMEWVNANTEENSQFVIMDSAYIWQVDQVNEWFPTLSNRKSLSTVQGYEWLPFGSFTVMKDTYANYKNCLNFGEACVTDWANKNHFEFTHLMVIKSDCPRNGSNCMNFFISTIAEGSAYSKIYENEDVLIFQRKNRK